MLLHVLRHIDSHDVLLIVEQFQRQLLCKLRFAHSCWTQEEEAACWLAFARQSCTRTKNGIAHCLDGCRLTNHLLAQSLRQLHKTLSVRSVQTIYGDSRPVADNMANLARCHFFLQHASVLLLLDLLFLTLDRLLQVRKDIVLEIRSTRCVVISLCHVDLVLSLRNLVFQSTKLIHCFFLLFMTHLQRLQLLLHLFQLFLHLLKTRLARFILLVLHSSLLDLQLQLLAFQTIDLFWLTIQLHTDVCAGLIHQINCLIRKESILDVSMTQFCSQNQSGIIDSNAVISLISIFQSTQNTHSVLHTRFSHIHLLESTFECSILLHILLILFQSCSADDSQLTSR